MSHTPQRQCEGRCESHSGYVRRVSVNGEMKEWGHFWYCDTAVASDRGDGLTVQEAPETEAEASLRSAAPDLLSTCKAIAALDYTRAATNGCAFEAHELATAAVAKVKERGEPNKGE